MFWKRKDLPLYAVTFQLYGRHPYRVEPEFQYEDGTTTVHVPASSFANAVKVARKYDVISKIFDTHPCWACRVIKVEIES